MAVENIALGTGIFSIGGVPVGLTKGGGQFLVERDYYDIEADGDFGPVEGRQQINREVPKLTINGLDLFTASEMLKSFPGLSKTTGTGIETVTGTLTIAAGDYVDVQWVGKRKDGKPLTIKVDNALNRANLEWALEDKQEIIQTLEYTGHYAEASRTTPPWSVVYGTAV